MVGAVEDELARVLFRQVGLGEPLTIEPFGAASNTHLLLTAAGGKRCVFRLFTESKPHSAVERMQRERWVLELLASRGVPVPKVLAFSEKQNKVALLLSFVDGAELGTVAAWLDPVEAEAAWWSAGAAFADCHRIDAASAAAAGCEQVGIRQPTRSRGPWHQAEAIAHLDALAVARPDIAALADFHGMVDAATPLYERAPLVLCQYDAHLWQFRVTRGESGWRCTGLLDWEHADLDDPDWDLAQLDGFRWTLVGSVPDAFFAGYGRRPSSPLYGLYRLERAAWILVEWARGAQWLEMSVPHAERFLRAFAADEGGFRRGIARSLA